MTILLLTSAAHSPGVTTLGLVMALQWPRPVLLVDADRQPDQSVLAGFLAGREPSGLGLPAVLQAYRERREADLWASATPLEAGDQARFLPGFSHPGMVALFEPVWAEFAAALGELECDVIVDAGRISPQGLPEPLLRVTATLLVVTGSRLVDLAALRLYLPLVADSGLGASLVVMGPGRPYQVAEIQEQFGLPVDATLAWAPEEAMGYLAAGGGGRRIFKPYLADARALVARLALNHGSPTGVAVGP